MIIQNKSAAALEYAQILAMLADCAPTEGAAQAARALSPSADREEVVLRQRKTTDARRLLEEKGMPSFGEVGDISASLERAQKGAALSMRELLDVADHLRCARYLVEYSRNDRHFETVLDEVFDRLTLNKSLETSISRSIIAEDMMADEASDTLADLRHRIRRLNNKVKDALQKYTTGASAKYLQENIVTLRGGRYVIPVKQEYRNEVRGLVHDTSASGATLFIEPMAVVEMNNEIKTLEGQEAHEIERILYALTAAVAEFSPMLRLNYENITALAVAFACAELSIRMQAIEPKINAKRTISLIHARHPLLNPDTVVPVDITFDEATTMLVITGPNTGGKTIALKTIGLFALMAQSGLHIPAEEESSLCLFDHIYADIGDEQSIEQSLSTFSAHMVSIVSILSEMSEQSLVLFDELGAGTDPIEGAALATAILERVLSVGAICAATTHYAELKAFALETEGVKNASCEFDLQTLRPTYKLIIGTPGKSNAFAISRRLGLSSEIVDRADALISRENKRFEQVIEKLEATRIAFEHERDQARKDRLDYESFRRDAEDKLRRRLSQTEKETERARAEAARMVESAKASSEFILQEMDALRKKKDSAHLSDDIAAARRAVREHLRKNEDKFNPVIERPDEEDYTPTRPIKRGDEVYLTTIGKLCTVLDDPDKNGNVTVASGVIRTRTNVRQLRLAGDRAEKKTEKSASRKTRSTPIYGAKVNRDFSIEFDVRGQNGEEAWLGVDKYLDEALMAGIKSVTIIHGKGTGALRTALWQRFKRDSRIASYRAGMYGEGDYGVTVVELK